MGGGVDRSGREVVSLDGIAQKAHERRWFVMLGLMWLFLSLFDLGITYWALAVGRATEANRLMAPFIHDPCLATPIRMLLVYLALKAAEAVHERTRYSSLPILACMNLHLGLTCVNN